MKSRVRAMLVSVAHGPDAGSKLAVGGGFAVIGTSSDADLQLRDDAVAPSHLELSMTAEGVRVRDLGTSNGTWLGKLRIHDVVLTDSSTVGIGRTTLSLRIDRPSSSVLPSTPAQFGGALAESANMRELFAILEQASAKDVSVVLEGESGVGKDALANAIHSRSNRATGPFVTLDCGAISPTLIESELFGHVQGAFTGADCARDGAFVQADKGTLFLDEIGELPSELQTRLLRVLEAREVRPLGGQATRRVDVRIVAATNRRLRELVERGAFRSDLYYRLAVLRVAVPPLRERRADILLLARAFLKGYPGFEDATLPPETEDLLVSHGWPGNVRELKNVIARYVILGPDRSEDLLTESLGSSFDQKVGFEDLVSLPYREARAAAVERFERTYVRSVLARAGTVVRAAKHAGVRRGSFHRMLQRIRPDWEPS